jgi:hypothetical protein
MESSLKCRYCNANVASFDFFCPNCGKQLKAKEISVSIGKQIGVYLLSFFLPPLGLWPAIKYLRHGDAVSKRIGIIAIVLTVISIIITLWSFSAFLNLISGQLNSQINGLGL